MEQLSDQKRRILNDAEATYYIPIAPALKNSSQSTSTRCAFDASAVNRDTKKSLNSILPIGFTGVSLTATFRNFRINEIGIAADVKKYYNSIMLHPESYPINRIIFFEDADPSGMPKEYVMSPLFYGIRPAGAITDEALKLVAREAALNCKDCNNDKQQENTNKKKLTTKTLETQPQAHHHTHTHDEETSVPPIHKHLTMYTDDWDLVRTTKHVAGKPFKPNKVICGLPSIAAKKQIIEIQDTIEQIIPGIKGRVNDNKLHMTLIAYNGDHNMKREMEDVLGRTVKLNQDMHARQLKIYGGHTVITVTCERALHISKELLEIAQDAGINHDPIQNLHITIFRNVGSEVSNIINENLAK